MPYLGLERDGDTASLQPVSYHNKELVSMDKYSVQKLPNEGDYVEIVGSWVECIVIRTNVNPDRPCYSTVTIETAEKFRIEHISPEMLVKSAMKKDEDWQVRSFTCNNTHCVLNGEKKGEAFGLSESEYKTSMNYCWRCGSSITIKG